jgi:N-acetylglutamate synthase-like GNAT family acetyltransferase
MPGNLIIRLIEPADIPSCERVLNALPHWFGIQKANEAYIRCLTTLPAKVATLDAEIVGFIAIKHHSRDASEIYVLAVDPKMHRRGVGRALVDSVEADLRVLGVSLLQVKTLGPSDLDEGYRRTRMFYEAMGFLALEETTAFWGSKQPCLIMVKPLNLSQNIKT